MANNIKVGIKFRPTKKNENKSIQWNINGSKISSKNSKYCFLFENVFNESSTNQDVYNKLGMPIVEKCFEGYNATILTYGQTSSGKTYTMMGGEAVKGVIELTIDDIFNKIQKNTEKSFNLSMAFIEIYNEKIYDLLVEKKHELRIFESQGEAMTNQKQVAIKSKEDFLKVLRMGNRNKHIASTNFNDQSSRSHTILSINIESTNSNAEIKTSRLFLVDLAGSEKPDSNKNSFNEGLHINKSLLALGKIIRQLTDKNVNVKNLRYRESVLTRLLSSSLGGNSFTSIICTASLTSLDETFYTICFAQNAEKAKCKPTVNGIKDEAKELLILKSEVKRLQKELEFERSRVFQESPFSINATYVVKGFKEQENTKKRKHSELDETFTQQSPKVFVKSLTKDEELIKKLKKELNRMNYQNEQLQYDLNEFNINLKNLRIENENLKTQIKEEERKKTKILQKCKILREKLSFKKESKMKQNSSVINDSTNYTEFINGLGKKQPNDTKNDEIAHLNNEISVLKSKMVQESLNYRLIEEKLKEQLENTLNAYQIIQKQLYETNIQIEQIYGEKEDALKRIGLLKENFKKSLNHTREQYHIILKQKQEQEVNFHKQLKERKNEELRDYLNIQEHYQKQYDALKITIENQKLKIDQLESKLDEFNDTRKSADEKKRENEKIKFIKQHFEIKLCEKVKYFEKLLNQREKELSALKKMHQDNESNCAAFGKLLVTN